MLKEGSLRTMPKKPTRKRRAEVPRQRKSEAAPSTPSAGEPSPAAPFPVVGVGASAGGLEALERFLTHVPKHSGMAFVVVQPLDPTHKGMLIELLQRMT